MKYIHICWLVYIDIEALPPTLASCESYLWVLIITHAPIYSHHVTMKHVVNVVPGWQPVLSPPCFLPWVAFDPPSPSSVRHTFSAACLCHWLCIYWICNLVPCQENCTVSIFVCWDQTNIVILYHILCLSGKSTFLTSFTASVLVFNVWWLQITFEKKIPTLCGNAVEPVEGSKAS